MADFDKPPKAMYLDGPAIAADEAARIPTRRQANSALIGAGSSEPSAELLLFL
jgi:hypothetical protein